MLVNTGPLWVALLAGLLLRETVGRRLVLYLAVLPGALAYFAWAYALVRVEAARLARTLYFVPAITILLSWVLLGEGPGASALAGGALAIAGVVIGREASPSSD
jgi:drug/metabolite transporter (DMT)-like permease